MPDALTPEEIERTSFPDDEGGYNRLHVDAFVRTMAAQIRRLQRELEVALERGEAPYRAAGKEIGDLIQNANERAAELVADALETSERMIKDAHNEVMVRRQEADTLHKRALTAQRDADRARDRIISEAQAQAAAMVERVTAFKRHSEAEARVIVQQAEREVRRLKKDAKQEAKQEGDKARAAVEREHAELASRLEDRIRALRNAEATLTRRVAALKTDHVAGAGEMASAECLPESDVEPAGRERHTR